MVSFESSGTFSKTEGFLKRLSKRDIFNELDHFGRMGVEALASATPTDTGVTAASWGYEVHKTRGSYSITWTNTHVDEQGTAVVILLDIGHGTGTGGYVQGLNFIDPAIRPIFDAIADSVWKAVTSA